MEEEEVRYWVGGWWRRRESVEKVKVFGWEGMIGVQY